MTAEPLSIDKFDVICRLCSEESSELFKLYLRKNKHKRLKESIKKYLNIKISPGDGLPDQICGPCIAKLDEMIEFTDKCFKVQADLQQILEEDNSPDVKVKPEPEEEALLGETFSVSDDDDSQEPVKEIENVKTSMVAKNTQDEFSEDASKKTQDEFSEDASNFVMSLIEEKQPTSPPLTKPKLKFKCTKCAKAYSRNSSLQAHINRIHEQNMEKCPECKKVFKSYDLWRRHFRMHNKKKPFVCEICNKAFSLAVSLRRHHETHTIPIEQRYKYDCTVCGKKFTSKNVVRAHMKLHTDSKNFMCDQCGKSFQTKGSLQVHYRIHTGEKPYECEVCGKRYAHVKPFKTHQLKHKELRPYVCVQCSKAFYSPDLLRRHSFIHSDTRPYPCSFCDKSFRNQWKRKVHERIHTGEKPYKCGFCPSAFYESGNLQKHCRNVHHQDYRMQHQPMYHHQEDQQNTIETEEYVTPVNEPEEDLRSSNPLLGHTIFSSSVEMLHEAELPV